MPQLFSVANFPAVHKRGIGKISPGKRRPAHPEISPVNPKGVDGRIQATGRGV